MDYSTMSKKELMKALNGLRHDIQTYRDKEEKTKLRKATKVYETVRELFYECPYCRHAKVETTVDKNGREADRVIELCNFGRCPYHQDFVEMADKAEDTVTQGLKELLED